MRKKTTPRIQKKTTASSRNEKGLIAKDTTAKQSVREECVLDNRSPNAA
jgi:hypothetical protein